MLYSIDKTTLKNGITQYTCWLDLSDSPVGILWVRIYQGESGKKIALLLNAMTVYYFQRKGVCSILHNEVLKDAEVLLSASGSSSGGKEFLAKFGFIHNEKLDIWTFIKKEV